MAASVNGFYIIPINETNWIIVNFDILGDNVWSDISYKDEEKNKPNCKDRINISNFK